MRRIWRRERARVSREREEPGGRKETTGAWAPRGRARGQRTRGARVHGWLGSAWLGRGLGRAAGLGGEEGEAAWGKEGGGGSGPRGRRGGPREGGRGGEGEE
ncbi:BKRF1 encodes EBNA-1 protein-like [Oryza sativa Japonica Group]|uniref:BKRF1 encodes EBNA-1 protein-like n=2 Tax=Oryza sativa subsp. japonica TaxID=39947 RepID=Q5QLL0_ORYSJ|nr:BKRF1 encodes EBNA-1 protein-like [Oryza sativa Japonica Group]BAD73707.1 BKRF1 encodes EBNA-1 protein-like [Oryza sativa Japonica Group]